jgi:hypothetical protein
MGYGKHSEPQRLPAMHRDVALRNAHRNYSCG